MAKMIVTDLDKTLLRSDTTLSAYTVQVLKKCQEKGIKIIFATARSVQASACILAQFEPDVFIGFGGGLIMAGGVVLGRFDIPADISGSLIETFLNTPEILCIYAINESLAFTNDRGKFNTQPGSTHYRHTDFSSGDPHRYLKISVASDCPSAVEQIASRFPMCDMLRYSGENLYRFAHRDAIKWNAVQVVSEYYQVGTDEFIAFGDDINDLEMLQKCGIGVAVANAIPAVKSAAKYICCSHEQDGVAAWIEERIL